MATYEGISIFFAKSTHGREQEVDGVVVRKGIAISDEGMEFVKGMAALLLPSSSSDDCRFLPLPEKVDTEAIRIQRARALLTCLTCGFQDNAEKAKAVTVVKLWLNNERSGPVRDILHEAQAYLLTQGEG